MFTESQKLQIKEDVLIGIKTANRVLSRWCENAKATNSKIAPIKFTDSNGLVKSEIIKAFKRHLPGVDANRILGKANFIVSVTNEGMVENVYVPELRGYYRNSALEEYIRSIFKDIKYKDLAYNEEDYSFIGGVAVPKDKSFNPHFSFDFSALDKIHF